MACAFAWWVSAVGVGATTGVVMVTRPSSKLQVNQVTAGKRARGLDERELPPCGVRRATLVPRAARGRLDLPWRAWAFAWPGRLVAQGVV